MIPHSEKDFMIVPSSCLEALLTQDYFKNKCLPWAFFAFVSKDYLDKFRLPTGMDRRDSLWLQILREDFFPPSSWWLIETEKFLLHFLWGGFISNPPLYWEPHTLGPSLLGDLLLNCALWACSRLYLLCPVFMQTSETGSCFHVILPLQSPYFLCVSLQIHFKGLIFIIILTS